jgi:integrase
LSKDFCRPTYHLTAALQRHEDWSANTRSDFVGAVQRTMNWAVRQGLIDRDPVHGMEKSAREAREVALTPEQYEQVMKVVDEPNFRDLLAFAWESVVRPQEIVRIEAAFVDFAFHRIVFPIKISKGKKTQRVVYLTEAAEDILRPLVRRHPAGPVFRNSGGRGWNKDSVNCAFLRLRARLGRDIAGDIRDSLPPKPPRFRQADYPPAEREAARAEHERKKAAWKWERAKLLRERVPKLHLGAFRKGWITEALKAGVDTISLAELAGHRDGTMISRHYAKVTQDPQHMAEMSRRARGR